MKPHHYLSLILIVSLLVSPFQVFADLVPDPTPKTFENQQDLDVSLSVNGVPLLDTSTSTLPGGEAVSVAYDVKLITKAHQNEPEAVREEILLSAIEDSDTYLELWSGEPFTASAALVESVELPIATQGEVSLVAPEPGSYFFVLYIGGEVRDRDAYCQKYDVLPEDCSDPEYWYEYPPEVIRPFFTYPFGSDGSSSLEYMPWWGGVRFAVEGTAVASGSNVLFIPGFTASRLYMTDTDGDEEPLWEPLGSEDIKRLAMNPDGTSKYPIYTRDIVDTIKGIPFAPTVHKRFMEYLDDLADEGKINAWKGYPYDWRYDVFDVVDDGALKEDGSREYLIDVVEELAATSKTGRVSIVAHSNGGLVAKTLMVRLEAAGKQDLVDRVVLLASPQTGTPKGLMSLLHGREKLLNLLIPAGVLRETLATIPGAYALAPSALYFERESAKVGEFAGGAKTDSYMSAFGESIDTAVEARSFALNDPQTRLMPSDKEWSTPLPLSAALVEKVEETHAVLDAWIPPVGVEVHEIAGWGQPTTRGARYTTITRPCFLISLFCTEEVVEYAPKNSYDGDNTVMSASAVLGSEGTYLDLYALGTLEDGEGEDRRHLDITESKQIHKYIDTALGLSTDYNDDLLRNSKPTYSPGSKIVGVHSPAIMHVVDDEGNVTGIFKHPDPESDLMYVREEIPGSAVELGGEGKYVILPEDGEYEINISGTGAGTFSVTFSDDEGNLFKEIEHLPISTSTEAVVTLDGTSVSQMTLDVDGDGKSDAKVTDSLSRKDAVKICKKEIGLVRTVFVKIYLGILMANIEMQGKNNKKFDQFVDNLKKYVQDHLESIPSERAVAIATCIHALENSNK